MISVYVFKIIHPVYGMQYVARVYTNGAITTEITFNHVPTQQLIEKRILLSIDHIGYESGLIC